jgi:uncharacterized protein
MNKKEIIKKIEENTTQLKEFGVKQIGLFGSALSGKMQRDSDIDFLVDFNEPSFDNYMDLKFFLENLFEKPVDLVMTNTLKPILKKELKGIEYVKAN